MTTPEHNTMTQMFIPVRAAIIAMPYVMADVFQVVGEWMVHSPTHGGAMCLHAQHVLRETPDVKPAELLAEMYWRTFYNFETAQLYGTDDMLKTSEQNMQVLTDSIINGLMADRAQLNAGSFHASPTQAQ